MGIKLGNICNFQSGGTPAKGNPDYFNGNIPWITTTALNGARIGENDAVDWITEKAINESAAKIVPAFSIMIGTRVGVGKVAINTEDMSTSQDIISLLDIDEKTWSKDYLCKFLQGQSSYLQSQARGATIKGIRIDVLANLDVPSIDYKEQQDVSKILDKVQLVIAARREELQKLDDLIKARFVEMFVDKGYQIKKVQDVLETAFWLMPATPEFVLDGEVPYITSKNIKNGKIDFDNVKYISKESYYSISSNRPTQIGDILVSMIGTLGQTAVIADNRLFYGQNLYLLRLDDSIIDTDYFCEFFNSDLTQHELKGQRNQSTQAYLKANHVEGLNIPIPPIVMQREFSTFVQQVDKSKAVVQKALDEAQLLFDSLMQKYFG